MGFPTGDRYKGTADQKRKLEEAFVRKSEPISKLGTPIWNGKIG